MMLFCANQFNRRSTARAYIKGTEQEVKCRGHIVAQQWKIVSTSVAGIPAEAENTDVAHGACGQSRKEQERNAGQRDAYNCQSGQGNG